MKKYILLASIALSCCLTSCENFLNTENLTKKDTSNFPQNKKDLESALIGIYSNLSEGVGCKAHSNFFVSCVASDDAFGGGGNNDKFFHAFDFLMSAGENMFENFWEVRYKGIFRSNSLIETMNNTQVSEIERKNILGETYFLRAFFYYDLASLFGTVPLVLQTEPLNLPKATPEILYGQIASDLKNAIEMLPSVRYSDTQSGHVTKWAAEAMMARVFLFYTGFYNKTEITLPDGLKITKANVIEWLNDCIANSGHDLLNDYRQIWPYTNSITLASYKNDNVMKQNQLIWAEDFGKSSPETLFSIKFSNQSTNQGNTLALGYSNQMCLFMGLRGGSQNKEAIYPFGQGWGAAPINPQVYIDWTASEPTDKRIEASIINLPIELPGYKKGADNNVQETDFYQKKIMPIRAKVIEADGKTKMYDSFSIPMFGNKGDYQTCNIQDLILIRYADVLLMHSELTETTDGINRVRLRANLSPLTAYSLKALQDERRWEFVGEGIRWNDIRRWKIAEKELEKQTGQNIYNFGVASKSNSYGGGYAKRYAETKGFFPIPESQIKLSENILKQNEGWGQEANYGGWTK